VDRKKRLGFGALVCVALQCSRRTTGLVLCALEFCTRIGFFHLEAANLGHVGDAGTEAEKQKTKFHSCLQCLIIVVVLVVVVIVVVPARLWVFCLQVLTTKERIGAKIHDDQLGGRFGRRRSASNSNHYTYCICAWSGGEHAQEFGAELTTTKCSSKGRSEFIGRLRSSRKCVELLD
jgi:hypothetical protein